MVDYRRRTDLQGYNTDPETGMPRMFSNPPYMPQRDNILDASSIPAIGGGPGIGGLDLLVQLRNALAGNPAGIGINPNLTPPPEVARLGTGMALPSFAGVTFGGRPQPSPDNLASADPSTLIDQLSNPPTNFPSAGSGVPLPPSRPSGTGGSGGVPLPRPRPTIAPGGGIDNSEATRQRLRALGSTLSPDVSPDTPLLNLSSTMSRAAAPAVVSPRIRPTSFGSGRAGK